MQRRLNSSVPPIFVLLVVAVLACASIGLDYGAAWLFCSDAPVYLNWRMGFVCPDALRAVVPAQGR